MPLPRPRLRPLLVLLPLAAGFFPFAGALAQRGIDETGDGLVSTPSAAATQQRIQDAREALEAADRLQEQTSSAQPVFTPVTPQLAVPIPGITFTPSNIDGREVVVPFLADYVSGLYRYLLGISTLVAIIVVIVGGFQYLLGQTAGSAEKGLGLIKDAIAGLVVLYASYIVLWTVNPKLVHLQPLRLTWVRTVGLGEGANNDEDMGSNNDEDLSEDTGSGATGGSCAESRCSGAGCVSLRVPNYKQGEEPWRRLPYGWSPQLISNGTLNLPACEHSASGSFSQAGCVGTIGQGGCGVTSLATVMAYYGLHISIPERVPGTRNGQPGDMHQIDPIDTAIYTSLTGFRGGNNGTDPSGLRGASRFFPQFESRSVRMTQVPELLRAGHPIIVGCRGVVLHTSPNATDNETEPRYNSSGHYFVLNGIGENNVIQIQDVGSRRFISAKLEDLASSCGATLVKPIEGAPERATAVWGGGRKPSVTVTMELHGGGRQCGGS